VSGNQQESELKWVLVIKLSSTQGNQKKTGKTKKKSSKGTPLATPSKHSNNQRLK